MSTVKENLIAARALIDTPEKWIKDNFEANGCFCASGAIRKAVSGDPNGPWSVANDDLMRALPEAFSSVPDFNDHPDTTHADIMALFDRAIAAQDEPK